MLLRSVLVGAAILKKRELKGMDGYMERIKQGPLGNPSREVRGKTWSKQAGEAGQTGEAEE
jgi:hypothetical protein